MFYLTVQEQLIGTQASAVQLPSLPPAQQRLYHQMLGVLTAKRFFDAETTAAMVRLTAQVRAELHW